MAGKQVHDEAMCPYVDQSVAQGMSGQPRTHDKGLHCPRLRAHAAVHTELRHMVDGPAGSCWIYHTACTQRSIARKRIKGINVHDGDQHEAVAMHRLIKCVCCDASLDQVRVLRCIARSSACVFSRAFLRRQGQ
jgi:hypothetical protein